LLGILLLIAAVACFAVLDTTTKRITAEVPVIMAVWFRYFFQAVITSALSLSQKGSSSWKTERPAMHAARGVLMLIVTLAAFFSLKFMPVGEFTAVVMTTPLLVTLLAARLLGEHVSLFRVLLVLGGFSGTLIIVRPGSQLLGWTLLLPLALVVANTGFQLLTSRMTRTEHPMTIQLYTSWIGTAVMALPLYWSWTSIANPYLWAGMVLMGIASAAGHFLLVMAFTRTPAAALMPYMYLQIGFAMVGGWFMFDHLPDRLSLIGIGLIACCGTAGALLTLLENRLRRAEQGA
jgi:drug/metabolite transporter (DMT)-like permease